MSGLHPDPNIISRHKGLPGGPFPESEGGSGVFPAPPSRDSCGCGVVPASGAADSSPAAPMLGVPRPIPPHAGRRNAARAIDRPVANELESRARKDIKTCEGERPRRKRRKEKEVKRAETLEELLLR